MKVNIEGKNFADIVVLFLLDKMNHPDEVLPGVNPAFDALMEIFRKKGLRSLLMKYYLSLGGQERVMYKRIRGVFTPKKQPSVLVLDTKRDDYEEVEEKKVGVMRKIERFVKRFTGMEV